MIDSLTDAVTFPYIFILSGQKIPPGLHVQMDFQTGKKQAKRMEKSGKPTIKRWDAGNNIGKFCFNPYLHISYYEILSSK